MVRVAPALCDLVRCAGREEQAARERQGHDAECRGSGAREGRRIGNSSKELAAPAGLKAIAPLAHFLCGSMADPATAPTRLGTLELRIPKLRQGTYFPPFLEPRKMSERALAAVVQEAWIGGVSTRRVDELVQALGMSGISKSQVSTLCREIDERVRSFLDRPLAGDWPISSCARARAGGSSRPR